MKKLGLPKKKKITITQIKKKAWSQFSLYIRLKYSDPYGIGHCYTCGAKKHYKSLQAGHGIGGRNNAVLFMEEVVRPQDISCNIFLRGNYSIFTRKLIGELGLEEYDRLVELSKKVVKYTASDYQQIYEKYKKLNESLTNK